MHRVYNLEVQTEHTYFVSKIGVLVHNVSGCARDRKGGIYEFPDASNGGKPYVGQSGDIEARLGQHERAGSYDPNGGATTTEVPGGKTAREIAEHQRIQELTNGVPARLSPDVANLRDPIGPARQHLLPKCNNH